MYTTQHKCSCGIDVHVDWMDCCVIEADGEGRVHKHIRTHPKAFLHALPPFREDGVVCVACLFTWYERADLCAAEGSPFGLGPALSLRAMHGGTAKNDRLASHNRAALRRGGRLPQADGDPRRMRATRDRLRRRKPRRHKRAEVDAHLQNTGRQYTLGDPLGRMATPQNRRGLIARFDHAGVQKHSAVALALVDGDDPRRAALERDLETTAHRHDSVSVALWHTRPGVGKRLALVLLDEIEPIARFPRVQAFVSDSRLVKRARESQGKRHGTSGQKIGNAQRTGAFSEAAGLWRKHNEPAQKDRAKLATPHGTGTALSLLAHHLRRAVDCLLTPHVAFDQAKFLAPESWRERPNLASHWRHRGKRPPLAQRSERSCSWAMSPHRRCLCRTVSPASSGVDGPSVPRLALVATRTHAWLTVLPRPRARHSLDGRHAGQASGVDGDGISAQPCFAVAPGGAPSAAAAHVRRPEPPSVCGAGLLLLPKPGAEIKQRLSIGPRGALGRAKTCLTFSHRESFTY